MNIRLSNHSANAIVLPGTKAMDLYDCLAELGEVARRFNWLLPKAGENLEELVLRHQVCVGFLVLDSDTSPAMEQQLATVLSRTPEVQWIAVLAPARLACPDTFELVSHYCCDFLYLPWTAKSLEEALSVAAQALDYRELKIHRRFNDRPIIGLDPSMQRLAYQIQKMAPVDAPVLLHGESGTGKELIARAIHYYSKRADAPFISVDCGSLPDDLVQSKLFGHEKGAFTGATERKPGVMETADGGTVFLDKLENLALNQQVNLLRCLQESMIEPVGSLRPRKVDIRIIAASTEPPKTLVEQGQLREDLYYRLNVLSLEAPVLRGREKDIELLAYHYLHRFRSATDLPRDFSAQAMAGLKVYQWPGNVRELVNRVRRAVVMCETEYIELEDLGFADGSSQGSQPIMTLTEARAKAEREVVLQSLKCTGYNISASARLLNISRLSMYRMIEKYSLVRKELLERAGA